MLDNVRYQMSGQMLDNVRQIKASNIWNHKKKKRKMHYFYDCLLTFKQHFRNATYNVGRET